MKEKLLGGLNAEALYKILDVCGNVPAVRNEVLKNHDNNLWWPLDVTDWRLRMVVAGWSSRISYNMIATYRRVVSNVNLEGYDTLVHMSAPELQNLIGSLGLFESRRQYLSSLQSFLDSMTQRGISVIDLPADELIRLIAQEVKGANFKVAQCAALYAKGYHCGIFPVDSGMKDMLGPCLGLRLPSGPFAHEVMRQHIEKLVNGMPHELVSLAKQSGYTELNIPQNQAPMWWAHLVLIYFKRIFCNKKEPSVCPLRKDSRTARNLGAMCDKNFPEPGGYRHVILEGPDRVGKTTLAEKLKDIGYTVIHAPYNPDHKDIFEYYHSLIERTPAPVVFDRTFISELTYGIALRGFSRLSQSQFVSLLRLLANKGYILLYLTEDIKTIRERLESDSQSNAEVSLNLEKLVFQYEECIEEAKRHIPVYRLNTSQVSQNGLLLLVYGLLCDA